MNALFLRTFPVSVVLVATIGSAASGEIGVITPPGSQGKEGDTWIDNSAMGQRYQQVFDASYFSGLPPGGGWIRDVYLRSDRNGPSSGGMVQSTQISFSTTAKDADSLSPVFANNVGSDNKVFFSASRSDFFVLGWDRSQSPQSFGGLFAADYIGSDGRFFYDPAKGNLLMDIQGLQLHLPPGQGLSFDAVTLPGHTSVRYQFPGGAEQGLLSSSSLVVEFLITPIPEPSLYVFLGMGIIFFYGLRWTK